MLNSGDKLAQFEILEKLGEGGMGAVYRARDTKLGREVALKVLPPEFLDDKERRDRFEREARMAARISHANVTPIYDLGEAPDPAGGTPISYIVMEFVDGQPLNEYLRDRRLDMSEVLRLAEKIAGGMAAAHKLDIVHRDIKLENVMVGEDGSPRILDFGLAKPVDGPYQSEDDGNTVTIAEDLTQVGKIVGTVNYMSPEQAQGEVLDTRSDVFSFGVLLYRLATGEAPFSGPTQVSTLAKIIEGSHEPARGLNESVDPELERIIDKCLQKSPDDRYQDTRDLVNDLRQLRRRFDSGISQSSMSTTSAAAMPSKRPAWRMPVLVIALLAVVGVGAMSVLRGDSSAPVAVAGENRLAVIAFENKTGDAELDWMETGLPEILLTDLAGCEGLAVLGVDRLEDELKRAGKDKDPSRSDWTEAARKLGASTLLSGSFFKSGGQIRITTRLEETGSGKVVLAEAVTGQDAFALVDSLSSRVTAELHVPMDDAPAVSVTEALTTSTEAYKNYHLGTEALYLGLNDEAMELYEKAVAADSSFALAHMRIGMNYMFTGRNKEGLAAFARAYSLREGLPARDRQLLDAYYAIWFTQDYDAALTGMKALVANYPDDKEARTLLGAVLVGLEGDSTRAWQEMDTVLAQDPDFPFALSVYAGLLHNFQQFPRAIALMEHYRETYPDSPDAYEELGGLYESQGDNARAMELYQEFRRRFPDNPDVLNNMATLAIRLRKFDDAQSYMDERLALAPDDDRYRRSQEAFMSNLYVWQGGFREAMGAMHRNLAGAVAHDDTTLTFAYAMELGQFHYLLGQPDSCVYYMGMAHPLASPQSGMRYPATVAELYPERYEEMKELYLEGANRFKASVPENLWPIADGVAEYMGACAVRDTTRMIAYFRGVMEQTRQFGGSDPGNSWNLGKLLVLTGDYENALPLVEAGHMAGGARVPTANAMRYLMTTYLMGVCYEGMGMADKAIDHYREVMERWGAADMELDEIRDTRRRLQNLTS